MKQILLKEFQETAVAELAKRFELMRAGANTEASAVLLNAVTGSGKTIMITQLLEELFYGGEITAIQGDPGFVCLWLSDLPEMNQQTYDKMVASSWIDPSMLNSIGSSTELERLSAGVWFLNTQKLGIKTNFVQGGTDLREISLWETLKNTVEADPTRFLVIIDEAHRGAQGAEAKEAETIMQKFVLGSIEIPPVPMLIALSATPDHFAELCKKANRPLRRWDVPVEDVRESGLLKDFVDLGHPTKKMPSEATLLKEAIEVWKDFCQWWEAAPLEVGELPVRPLLLVQVADAKANSKSLSQTDLDMVIATLLSEITHDVGDTDWIAHCFDVDDVVIAGQKIRHIAPSATASDPDLKVLLAKTAVGVGWDQPSAEVLLALRNLKDETAITQMVGRMIRAPLARRIDSDQRLNSVTVLVPYYQQSVVEQVIKRLATDPGMPPSQVRDKATVSYLNRATGKTKETCFQKLAALPSYRVTHPRPCTPVSRLARLADLLLETGWVKDPVKIYRKKLVDVLLAAQEELSQSDNYARALEEAALLTLSQHHVQLITPEGTTTVTVGSAKIALSDLDDIFTLVGRKLGEGLHNEYLRRRRQQLGPDADGVAIKLELYALVNTNGTIRKLNTAADELRAKWTKDHKAAITAPGVGDALVKAWEDIEGANGEAFLVPVNLPEVIDGSSIGPPWRDHLYIDDSGNYHEKMTSWEARALDTELSNPKIVAFYRNPPRKSASVGAFREEGNRYYAIFPDFIVFRKTPSGLLPEIVDPHLLADPKAPERARGLAQYAAKHAKNYGRIELVIYNGLSDEVGKRIDLLNEKTRKAVGLVSNHASLQALFDDL